MTKLMKKIEIYNNYLELIRSCKDADDYKNIQSFRKATKIAIKNSLIEGKINLDKINTKINIGLIVTQEVGLGLSSIICVMLHDSVVDNKITIEEIKEEFDEKIAHILGGLKEVTHLYASQKVIDSENFRKLLLSFAEDIRVQLISLAEKLYELRNSENADEKHKQDIANEINYIYIPFAHRLGLYNIKSEMEDTSLHFLQPVVYNEIKEKLIKSKFTREKYISEFVSPLIEELKKRGIKFKMKSRTKTIASILNKMTNKQVEFEEIYDIFALRFIIDSTAEEEKADCWKVYSIVTDKYTPNPQRLRDWITVPKSNGYQSLQTTVLGPGQKWVEVQIRSERMDDIAEKGFAAHWRYKGGKSDSTIANWLNELRDILESHDDNAIELLNDININLQDKEVHVFTPKGDLITLQAGSTLLDFAYSIHTDVGCKCVGGIINQKNESLRYILQNGDQVSVLTSTNQTPKSDWLNFAITSKARNKIRQYLKEELNRQADIGKELVLRRFKNWKMEFSDEILRKLMHHYKQKFALDLYQGIAEGKFDISEIKDVLANTVEITEQSNNQTKDIKVDNNHKTKYDVLLIDKNINNVEYKFANCCNPVYGDDIIGFVSIGQGIKVHRRECNNAKELMRRYPYRIVKTQWTNEGVTSYQVVLSLTGDNNKNIISKITDLISKDNQISMRAISINSTETFFEGTVTVLIRNTDHLSYLIQRLKLIPGIKKVGRKDSFIDN